MRSDSTKYANPFRSGGLLMLGLLLPFSTVAQSPDPEAVPDAECPGERISEIFIDNHSIFDPESIPDEGHLRWAYRTANSLHMRTRESFITDQLLFEAGDCYDPRLIGESGRILRGFRFLASADVFSVPQDDGTRHVVVDTRDEWTTKVSLGIRMDDGLRFDGGSLVEENFLGRGVAVGAYHRQRREQRAIGAFVEVPRLRGTGWDLEVGGSQTRAGNSVTQMVEHPFLGEVGTHALRQRVVSEHDLYNWILPDDGELTHLILPVREGRVEMTGARRFGVPGHLLMLGGGLSHEWVRTGGIDGVTGIAEGDFGERTDVDPTLLSSLEGQMGARETTRLNVIAGLRRIEFQERTGLDVLRGVQDVPTGRQALVTLGQSLGGPRDLFGRIELFGGFAGDLYVGQIYLSSEGRRVEGGVAGTRDVLAELHAFLYRPIGSPISQTILLRGAVQAGWRMDAPFQIALGGPAGVRGLREDTWPGGRRFLLSVEDRILLPGPFPDLVDLGVTVFGDLGRMYDAGVPFGTDSGWQGAVGAGLRIGFPAGSSSVIRADVAMPVGRDAPSGPVFRIHAQEWLGILGEFRSGEMDRVRRSGVAAEFLGVGRDTRRP